MKRRIITYRQKIDALLTNPALYALTLLFLVLLIPYIMHYYTLENEVQKMYGQYDRILEHCNIIREEVARFQFLIESLAKANERGYPQAFWINSSGNALVKRLIDRADESTKDEIERLIDGEILEKEVRLDRTSWDGLQE